MRIVLFANTDWFLYNFKRSLACALREAGHELILMSPDGEHACLLRAEGFTWQAFPLSRSGINPFAELILIWRLWRAYRALRPDVVHHFTIKCVIYGSLAARWAGVARVVNSITGLGFAILANTPKARLIRPVVLVLYRVALRGSHVLFQNQDNLETLRKFGVLERAQPEVVPGDGIDTEHFSPDPGHMPGNCVLMMGRLLHSKGVEEYVAAARIVRQQVPAARFLLAGAPDPGNPECISEAQLAEWRAEAAVEFLGQRADVLALQQAADVVVLPSTQGEGMPRALLEGAACGKPMVATDVPGSRELVIEGENGFLVPPSDAGALAEAILRLLNDSALAQRMGAKARERVVDVYSNACVTRLSFQAYGLTN
ncbi:glycosyltransferase family 4 protein [Uliginosibacterium gangwonense]|uniref:glycosyltransferase family 4 protein n=1 Tax=Uliginosibacterium gangwonense TaxID=392736 RepID=UPI00036F6107|nr:glycosyltransferase family 4 protein [Uliginosibacterium gangwonense]